jgi:predicted transglutaminase-like cysteine proteinase
LVNNKFNELPWIADKDKWSAEDYWATPFETITQFGGDCEDMAIGKFLALRLMGIPKKNLHLGYVKVKATGESHMILVWVSDDRSETMVLDNMINEVKSGKQRTDLLAIYLTSADGELILLNDDGQSRSIKAEISPKKMQKLETVKKRMRENQEKYKAYNDGRPLMIL